MQAAQSQSMRGRGQKVEASSRTTTYITAMALSRCVKLSIAKIAAVSSTSAADCQGWPGRRGIIEYSSLLPSLHRLAAAANAWMPAAQAGHSQASYRPARFSSGIGGPNR
jgi:hypothetical protein